MVFFFVKFNNKWYEMGMDTYSTVADLKEMVEQKSGVPKKDQCLQFVRGATFLTEAENEIPTYPPDYGKTYTLTDDTQTLGDLGICSEMTIMLTVPAGSNYPALLGSNSPSNSNLCVIL